MKFKTLLRKKKSLWEYALWKENEKQNVFRIWSKGLMLTQFQLWFLMKQLWSNLMLGKYILMKKINSVWSVGPFVLFNRVSMTHRLWVIFTLASVKRHIGPHKWTYIIKNNRLKIYHNSDWPKCDALLSYPCDNFPTEKVVEYQILHKPLILNDVSKLDLLLGSVYKMLTVISC